MSPTSFDAQKRLLASVQKVAYVEGFKKGLLAGEKMRVESFRLFGKALAEKLGEEATKQLMMDVAKAMDEIAEQMKRDREKKA